MYSLLSKTTLFSSLVSVFSSKPHCSTAFVVSVKPIAPAPRLPFSVSDNKRKNQDHYTLSYYFRSYKNSNFIIAMSSTAETNDDDNSNNPSVKDQDATNAEWDEMAGQWDEMAVGYRDAFYDLVWKHTKLDPNPKDNESPRIVVDFGCGTGLLTEKMRQASPTSQYICIDPAPGMIKVVKEKIEKNVDVWQPNSVKAFCIALSNYYHADDDDNTKNDIDATTRSELDALVGKVDLIVASSVIYFIPKDDLAKTMKVLGKLLKPNTGMICHADWSKTEETKDGFTKDYAAELYSMADCGLQQDVAIENMALDMGGGHIAHIFVGVAKKN